jgi:hypothetical protein
MLLVIFGAGASYDSASRLPPPAPGSANPDEYWESRPPLANQLFDDQRTLFRQAMDRFKNCMPLVPLLRRNPSVERELARVREQSENYPPARRELAAIQYYLHFVLFQCQGNWRNLHGGITSYVTLVREIDRWRHELKEEVCFVTFNYDTMLEEAVFQVLGIPLSSLDSYIKHPYYCLIKPHGSVNWGREVDGVDFQRGISQQHLIETIDRIEITDRYRIVNEFPMLWVADCYVFPALAIPVEKKDEFSCPKDHVERLEHLLPSVTRVMTVGWRATEADFLEKLRLMERGPNLMIVSGDEKGADETYANLRGAMRRPSHRVVKNGFTGLIGKLEQLEEFLR